MKFFYYGVKNINTNKIYNMGCSDNAKRASEAKLKELKLQDPNGNYKLITFFGRV